MKIRNVVLNMRAGGRTDRQGEANRRIFVTLVVKELEKDCALFYAIGHKGI
jgi:hypothetical protein